jgi:hypothetical protein
MVFSILGASSGGFGAKAHFPEVVLLIILKEIFAAISSQHPEAQGPRFLPANQHLDHRIPGPLTLEFYGPFMETVAGIGFYHVGQKQGSWPFKWPSRRKS